MNGRSCRTPAPGTWRTSPRWPAMTCGRWARPRSAAGPPRSPSIGTALRGRSSPVRTEAPVQLPGRGLSRLSQDVWAVGTYYARWAESARTLGLHWDGSRWEIVPTPNGSPNLPFNAGHFYDVKAISAVDAWAIGTHLDGMASQHGLTAHWDGSQWRMVAGITSTGTPTFSASTLPGNQAWAVGQSFDKYSEEEPTISSTGWGRTDGLRTLHLRVGSRGTERRGHRQSLRRVGSRIRHRRAVARAAHTRGALQLDAGRLWR